MSADSYTRAAATAAAIQASQGLTTSQKIYNRTASFPLTSPDVVFVKSAIRVTVTLTKCTGDTSLIFWRVERDPADQIDAGDQNPSLSGQSGPQVSFAPSARGDFCLIPYLSSDGNGTPDPSPVSGPLPILRFSICAVGFKSPTLFVAGQRYLLTGRLKTPVSGMNLSAVCVVQGGGAQKFSGRSQIVLGNIGNLLSTNTVVNYDPSGTARESSGSLPVLDTTGAGDITQPITVFRSDSNTSTTPTQGGLEVDLTSLDNPEITWVDPHPYNGNPAKTVTGGHGFRDYAVACSSNFPTVYIPLGQITWTAAVCAKDTQITNQNLGLPANPVAICGTPSFSMTYSPSSRRRKPYVIRPEVECGGPTRQSRQVDDFALGQVVGLAMAGQCLVYFGELLGVPSSDSSAIEMLVQQTLVGDRRDGTVIRIPYSALGYGASAKKALAHAWDHVTFGPRVPATALITGRKIGDLQAGDPIAVTSRKREVRIVADLIAKTGRVQDVEGGFKSMSLTPDYALGGFRFASAWYARVSRGPEFSLRASREIIDIPAVPIEALMELLQYLLFLVLQLSIQIQLEMRAFFATLALRSDLYCSLAGIRSLSGLAAATQLPPLSSDMIDRLSTVYRRLTDAGHMTREVSLDRELNIRVAGPG
uniref:Uncharacterized protein n=1 Tax=Solibacter usitatus (strain Ellin6076) TaxID=234267 RepID=Q01RE8_SOLUE